MSLRKRLLVAVVATIAAIGGVTVVKSYYDSRHEVQELFDAQLAAAARLMLSLALTGIAEGDLVRLQERLFESAPDPERLDAIAGAEYDEFGHSYEIKLTFQVWDSAGNLVLRSANAPLHPLSPQPQGYSDSSIRGEDWRVFGVWNPARTYRVQTGQRYDVRNELIESISQRVSLPFLLLPLLALSLWYAVGRALAPLDRVAQQVADRDAHNLQPVDTESVPEEVRPLIESINRLLQRLEVSLDKERRFTADAAHELRTPLAALRTHVQLALSARDKTTLNTALRQTLVGVDRATHLVEQLLSLARIEPQAASVASDPVDLRAVLVDVVAELSPAAIERQQEIGLDDSGAAPVCGSVDALRVLVRNLVDNAIRYTPVGGQIQVQLAANGHGVDLCVEDSGPGIDPDQRARVFERFYRGETRGSGCGIGLSIVERIVALHNASITLARSESLGGLSVRVGFPAPTG